MIKQLLILLTLLAGVVYGQYERPGSTDAQFLKIGVSARASALGGAYISVSEGAEAAYYNAAALARVKGTALSFTHTRWFAGINHEYAAVSHNFGIAGTFALSVTALYTDEMKVRTPLQPDGTGETFYAGNYRAGLSYSRYLTDRVSFGGTVHYVNMSLYEGFSAEAVAIDIATLYVTDFRGFRFGMKIANFGSNIKYVNESYPLPTNFTFGMSVNAIEAGDQTVLVSASAVKPNDSQPLGSVGVEWNYGGLLFLRGGYRVNHEVARYSFGMGVAVPLGGSRVSFDYAYSDFTLLGAVHRIGIGMAL